MLRMLQRSWLPCETRRCSWGTATRAWLSPAPHTCTPIKWRNSLDAFIPEDGQCALDLLPPDIGTYFRNVATELGEGWRLPGGEGQLDLWGLKPGEARDFVSARLCDFEEPVRLGKNRESGIPAVFVSCVAEGYPAR